MAVFPLRQRPKESYREVPRCFGTNREGGYRAHAGVDLYAPAGTEILAIEDGEILRGPYAFYAETYAVDIAHSFGIARYCEIEAHLADGLAVGSLVKEGQVIGRIGELVGIHGVSSCMLHLELFSGRDYSTGTLSQPGKKPYDRREDLIDPTDFLDALQTVAV